MALNRFHSNHLICVLSIVEGGVGFIKIGVVVTISRGFFVVFFLCISLRGICQNADFF